MNFKENDRIIYQPVGGALQTSTGIIKRIIHQSIQHNEKEIKIENELYVIENDYTHKETTYKRNCIIGLINKETN